MFVKFTHNHVANDDSFDKNDPMTNTKYRALVSK